MKKKLCIALEISRFLCFCEIHRFQNLWRHLRHCYIMEVTLNAYFLWILSTIKMKLGQILLCCMRNISNMFLAQCWRPETSFRPCIMLLKWQCREIWSFLIVYIYHFKCPLFTFSKKMKRWNLNLIIYWVIWAGC